MDGWVSQQVQTTKHTQDAKARQSHHHHRWKAAEGVGSILCPRAARPGSRLAGAAYQWRHAGERAEKAPGPAEDTARSLLLGNR